MSEKTLSLIKPDAVERNLIGKIIQIFEDNNLTIDQMKKIHVDIEFAKKACEFIENEINATGGIAGKDIYLHLEILPDDTERKQDQEQILK